MRIAAFAVAAFVVSGSAAAQSWEEYSYPEYAFSVAFPANPKIETTTYEVADGRSIPANSRALNQTPSRREVSPSRSEEWRHNPSRMPYSAHNGRFAV